MVQHHFDKDTFVTLLSDLCSYKTISSAHDSKSAIDECSAYLMQLFSQAGFDVAVYQTEGNPVVVAKHIANPNFQTIAIYNHMDVQPVDEAAWKKPPFEATIDGDRVWARGASDDKGPALCAFLAAQSCIQDNIPLNYVFIWEFEEEIGSTHFGAFLREHAHEVSADSMLVSDTLWIDEQTPTITYALRGLITFEVSLQTAEREVHSGTTGGVAVNPILTLARILSRCTDEAGRVIIPGMPSPHIANPPNTDSASFSLSSFKATYGLTQTTTNDTNDAADRITKEPTFEIHGIDGGYPGQGVKTIVPPRATAKVSMRLAPGQDPATVLATVTAFLTKLEPSVTVTPYASAEPYQADVQDTYHKAATTACRQVTGHEPVYVREGGSIGAVVAAKEALNVPIVLLGLSTPQDGYHEPNESFSLHQAEQGMALFAAYFQAITSS